MKICLLLSVLAVAVIPVSALQMGDTYEQVVAEKGVPTTKLEAGQSLILNYPDQRVKLKAGKVVELNSPLPTETRSAEAPPSTSSGKSVAGRASSSGWTTDYASALDEARQSNKKVFLFFTGSDWCGWCKRLDGEILSTGEFNRYAKENLILVKLDFPRSFKLPEDVQAQNEKLAEKYRVRGYPAVIVLSPAGKVTKQMGYQQGGPSPFIDALDKL